MHLERVGRYRQPRRFARLTRLDEWPADMDIGSTHFCLFVACDASAVSDESLARFADRTLSQGAVFLHAWGPRCTRMELAFDEVIVARGLETGVDDRRMTTSDTDWSLEEALYFFLYCHEPSSDYRATCRAWVVLAIGDIAPELRDLLARFRKRQPGRGPCFCRRTSLT
jgi:hypothetical protein